jgi:hypothetical protein
LRSTWNRSSSLAVFVHAAIDMSEHFFDRQVTRADETDNRQLTDSREGRHGRAELSKRCT